MARQPNKTPTTQDAGIKAGAASAKPEAEKTAPADAAKSADAQIKKQLKQPLPSGGGEFVRHPDTGKIEPVKESK